MKFFQLLLLNVVVLADFSLHYKTDSIDPSFVTYTLGNDKTEFKAYIDLQRPYSFVYSFNCIEKESCDHNDHKVTYDPTKSGGKPLDKQFIDNKYNDFYYYEGEYYNDTMHIGNQDFNLEFGLVEYGEGGFSKLDGVLGLGIGESGTDSVVN
ncbi:unnamed protein product [Bursaphelenchus okinawaensis]|uniref:Peptidase A1 domain-containing protein n=1 Tax=Bursaphelenchus okinawaensis TaxID=465554 RepID=A0A811L6Y3_9BILA|nr:unnamed protein product [Bursaphelenchus okinawaensis]CAG9119028.1 unnamed protein product [Bursaphelenchus okinawaensis]